MQGLERYTTGQTEETGADDSALFYITEEGGEYPMELFKLFGTIAINNSDANKSIKDTTGQASKAEGAMSKTFKKIGAAVAVAFSAEKIIQFGKACVESAASVKAMNSQFEQTFSQGDIDLTQQAADAIKRVGEESNILDTRLKGVGTSIYAFAKTTGMESTEALGMMERALKVTADSAAYYDRSLEDTAESLKSFLKGNYENDSALGLSCTEVTRNTKANELYGQSFKDLSESQKQLTLLAMVEDANKLSGALGQASREGSGWENVVGNMKEAWNQFKAVVGTPLMEKLIPVIETMTDKMSILTDKLKDSSFDDFKNKLSSLIPESTQSILADFATNIGNMASKMGSSVFQTFGDSFNKIKESIQTTSPFLEQLGNSYLTILFNRFEQMGSYISGVVVPVFNLLVTVLTDIGIAIWEAIAPYVAEISNKFTELSNMVTEAINTYIVPTVQTFIAMIQELWNENKDKVTKIGVLFEKVFSFIADIIGAGVEVFKQYIMPFFEWFATIVQDNMGTIEEIFQTAFDKIGAVIDFFIALFEGDWQGMWEAVEKWSEAGRKQMVKIFELMVSVLGNIGGKIRDAVVDKFEDIKQKMNSKIREAKLSVLTTFMDISNGIKEKIETAKTTVKDGLDKIKSFFDKLKLKLPDIKLPHFKLNGKFDLSNGQVPKIGVEWYAKGAVLNQPTVFGINPATGKAMVGGEAGAEAVAPIDVLQNYVRQAVMEANATNDTGTIIKLLMQMIELLTAIYGKDTSLKIDGREFGRMVNKYA